MNTKQALTLDPFPILNFKEASKKQLKDIKIMHICEKHQMKKKKKKLFQVGWWVVNRGGAGRWWWPWVLLGVRQVGVVGVADLSSWCGSSPVQRVVVSDLL